MEVLFPKSKILKWFSQQNKVRPPHPPNPFQPHQDCLTIILFKTFSYIWNQARAPVAVPHRGELLSFYFHLELVVTDLFLYMGQFRKRKSLPMTYFFHLKLEKIYVSFQILKEKTCIVFSLILPILLNRRSVRKLTQLFSQ